MKKAVILTLLFIFILSSLCLGSVSASSFVPSISIEDSIIVTIKNEDGREIIGYLTDENGNTIETVYRDDIIDTSVLEIRNGSNAIPQDAKDLLIDTYKVFTAENISLSNKIPVLNDIAKNGIGSTATADDLIVRDIYDFTVFQDKFNQHLATDGNTVTLKLALPTSSDKFIYAVVLIDGVWKPVTNVVNNNDGTIDVTFSEFCPVMFVVGDKQPLAPTPSTGDTSKPHILILIMLVSALCLIGCLVLLTRSSKKRSHHHKHSHKADTNKTNNGSVGS